ncbi:hypothetical protein FO440_14520 [Mucilaginibacter corticis]|uniref:TerB family tellurite resistance protein n=1 Tax=Mucilaginibacter corticis TaxID=2597670 RepID=A0A556MLZ2_9SPHI|nr:hypothetical protein [Mucilaginibacter corticis]TSJ40947.1 hypothetical protein FO440_14520 [Mucilaginibacter corticis]
MKKSITLLMFFMAGFIKAFSQQSTIDVIEMHQLINQSKNEHTRQVNARNNQATVSANEQANLTLLQKLKNISRTLQQRYHTLSTAVSAAEIGIEAKPMLSRIIANQGQIISLTEKNPAIALLGTQTEIEFAGKAESLLAYVTALTLSIGDVNQMKASDRKLLFDDVTRQLSVLQELSGNLVQTLTYANLHTVLRSLKPFQNYVDLDKNMAQSILQNAKYLKK